ncbi:HNH endonuclease signature motif containing protein [uncultured Jannaschia sp.]|uniref:HNH endonuclease signature motif containing protein n=1 Tax=uncultured Jannaschia sp. TaxID=293347 RepID=UPI002635AF8C|nr:HNH endonuclease signature motif containing protein [uncultured Jannaschia sp.]
MAAWPYCTSNWKRLRLVKLAACPLCFICERRGRLVEATVVDHITPIRQGGPAFPELAGLMSLCKRCHDEKTASFDRARGNATGRRFKGCGADGNPVDPSDGWWGGGP